MTNSLNSKIVCIGDPKDVKGMLAWAKKHCPSLITVRGQDVSDASYQWDEIYEFYFADERNAMLFQLKWK